MGASIPVQIGQVIDNKFRIDRVLAQGGMGVLCAATHLHLDQKIAVKFRLGGAKADATRFMREAQLAVRLQNRHVCRVMDLGFLDESTPYIVMEYLDGKDLAMEVHERGPLPIDESVEYLLQACDAMAEAHALGIVHRDIKPENLFLARQHDGRSIVKVLDFGISKQHGMTLTTESDLMGTPAYMAHEQWASAKHVTSSVDIYALGATLHFLLAGAPPFHATTIPEMFGKISTEKPPPLRTLRAEVPAELEQLVLSCLARTPAERPSDVLAISDALLPFAPGRKRAALSVVGRAFARSSTPGTPEEGVHATVPERPVTTSTNDLAVSVRSSSDDVISPRRGRSVVYAGIGLAAVATIVIAIAVTRGGGTAAVSEPPPSVPAPGVANVDAAAVVADTAPVVAEPVDAAAVEPDAGVAAKKDPVRPRDAGARPARVTVPDAAPLAPPDAAPIKPTPIDAAAAPIDAHCEPGDYRCSLRRGR